MNFGVDVGTGFAITHLGMHASAVIVSDGDGTSILRPLPPRFVDEELFMLTMSRWRLFKDTMCLTSSSSVSVLESSVMLSSVSPQFDVYSPALLCEYFPSSSFSCTLLIRPSTSGETNKLHTALWLVLLLPGAEGALNG